MASAEKGSERSRMLASLDLQHMKGVGEALAELVKEEFKGDGLKGLEDAIPEDQKRIVQAALEKARKRYVGLEYHEKVSQVGKIEEAYNQGLLTLPDLLQGLGLKAQVESGRRGFLDKFLDSWVKF